MLRITNKGCSIWDPIYGGIDTKVNSVIVEKRGVVQKCLLNGIPRNKFLLINKIRGGGISLSLSFEFRKKSLQGVNTVFHNTGEWSQME